MQTLNWKPVPPPTPVTLRGRYVTLEPLDAGSHAVSLWRAVNGHDELWEFLPDGPYASVHEFHAAIASKQHSPGFRFLAVIPDAAGLAAAGEALAGQAAGYASFMRIDAANGAVEVGNILYTPALQRTRAATEAMYLMARHIFEDLGYRRYEWKCNVLNEPSRRAALRLGFTFEGIFRQHMVVKDRNRDTAWFSMLDREWPECKLAFETWLNPANFGSAGKQIRPLSDLRSSFRRPEN